MPGINKDITLAYNEKLVEYLNKSTDTKNPLFPKDPDSLKNSISKETINSPVSIQEEKIISIVPEPVFSHKSIDSSQNEETGRWEKEISLSNEDKRDGNIYDYTKDKNLISLSTPKGQFASPLEKPNKIISVAGSVHVYTSTINYLRTSTPLNLIKALFNENTPESIKELKNKNPEAFGKILDLYNSTNSDKITGNSNDDFIKLSEFKNRIDDNNDDPNKKLLLSTSKREYETGDGAKDQSTETSSGTFVWGKKEVQINVLTENRTNIDKKQDPEFSISLDKNKSKIIVPSTAVSSQNKTSSSGEIKWNLPIRQDSSGVLTLNRNNPLNKTIETEVLDDPNKSIIQKTIHVSPEQVESAGGENKRWGGRIAQTSVLTTNRSNPYSFLYSNQDDTINEADVSFLNDANIASAKKIYFSIPKSFYSFVNSKSNEFWAITHFLGDLVSMKDLGININGDTNGLSTWYISMDPQSVALPTGTNGYKEGKSINDNYSSELLKQELAISYANYTWLALGLVPYMAGEAITKITGIISQYAALATGKSGNRSVAGAVLEGVVNTLEVAREAAFYVNFLKYLTLEEIAKVMLTNFTVMATKEIAAGAWSMFASLKNSGLTSTDGSFNLTDRGVTVKISVGGGLPKVFNGEHSAFFPKSPSNEYELKKGVYDGLSKTAYEAGDSTYDKGRREGDSLIPRETGGRTNGNPLNLGLVEEIKNNYWKIYNNKSEKTFSQSIDIIKKRNSVFRLGYIKAYPVGANGARLTDLLIPFEFNANIEESGYAAKYEATQLLGRNGDVQSYIKTEGSALTITTKYYAMSGDFREELKNPVDGLPITSQNIDHTHVWMDFFSMQRIQMIENALKSLVFSNYEANSNYKYFKPPVVKIILDTDELGRMYEAEEPNKKGGNNNEMRYTPYGNLLKFPYYLGSDVKMYYKTFFVTKVEIKKNFEETPIYINPIGRTLDTMGFEVSIQLVEADPNYVNILPNFQDFYELYRNGLISDRSVDADRKTSIQNAVTDAGKTMKQYLDDIEKKLKDEAQKLKDGLKPLEDFQKQWENSEKEALNVLNKMKEGELPE